LEKEGKQGLRECRIIQSSRVTRIRNGDYLYGRKRIREPANVRKEAVVGTDQDRHRDSDATYIPFGHELKPPQQRDLRSHLFAAARRTTLAFQRVCLRPHLIKSVARDQAGSAEND
jgi:hypothetical protein